MKEREFNSLESTGIGGCGMGGEVWEGCWVSLDFWIGWCSCLVHWGGRRGRKSSLGWVFRSSVWNCCIWGSVGPPGGARGLGSSYIEEPHLIRHPQSEGLLSTSTSGRKRNRWDWQEESEEKNLWLKLILEERRWILTYLPSLKHFFVRWGMQNEPCIQIANVPVLFILIAIFF